MTAISTLLRQAIAQHAIAGRTALSDGDGTLGYVELGQRIDAAAEAVRALGMVRGQPIGFVTQKTFNAVTGYFGAMQAGACVCFVEPGLALQVLADQMAIVGMRHLVVDAAHWDQFQAATLPGTVLHRLERLWEALERPVSPAPVELGADDKAMLLFTSGSTGNPKGVLLAHRGLVCNALELLRHTGIGPDDRLLHLMPIYHTNGVNNQLIVPFLAGASVHLVERFHAESAVDLLRTGSFTYMTGVPTIYARMLPHLRQNERFPSLRFLRCGSAPITVALHRQIEAAFDVPWWFPTDCQKPPAPPR